MIVSLGKCLFLSLLSFCSFIPCMGAATGSDPKANPEAIVTSGRARFTVLTPRMIRIQYSSKGLFEDRATFAVINRNLPLSDFSTREENGFLYIETGQLTLRYKIGSTISPSLKSPNNLSITMKLNGRDVICRRH